MSEPDPSKWGLILADLQKKAAVAEEERKKEAQAKAQKELVDVQTKLWERASAYTNLMLVAGYAGAFTLLSYTRAQLPNKAVVLVSLLLGFSLLIFILFEIFKMVKVTGTFLKYRPLILSDMTPDAFFANLEQYRKAEATQPVWWLYIWIAVLVACIGAALLAIGVMFYDFIALLTGLPLWPT